MSTSLIVITIALHSVFSVHVTKDYTEAKETCIVETTGKPSFTLEGSCSDYIQAVIDDHVYNYPELPYRVVINGHDLSKV